MEVSICVIVLITSQCMFSYIQNLFFITIKRNLMLCDMKVYLNILTSNLLIEYQTESVASLSFITLLVPLLFLFYVVIFITI